jgi:arylsulfatase A-like enzyme
MKILARRAGRACAVATLATVLVHALAPDAAAADRPNVVLIVVDDMSSDDLRQLPRLRELLFDPGVELTRFVAANALCAPSRVSILRGQYGHNTGLTGNHAAFARAHAAGLEQSTLATWLQAAGYATGLFGKYINGYGRKISGLGRDYVPPGWTEWYGGTPGHGYGFWLNENGTVVQYPDDGPHANDVLADLATAFVARHAGAPMFLYIAPGSPHGAAPPAHRHEGAFADLAPPEHPSTDEQDVSDKPAWIQALPRLAGAGRKAERYRNRLRSMLSVEDLVAAVMDALRAHGELDHTYFVFTSDNGFHYGEHRLKSTKATIYDEAIVVPTAIRGPGVTPGERIPHLALGSDLAPTIAAWAGAAVPDFVDGMSLTPLLRADRPSPADWRTTIAIEHPHPGPGDGPSPGFVGIRQERCKFALLETGEEELYDTALDPYELRSVHDSIDDATRAALESSTRALASCSGRTCRDLETSLPIVDCSESCAGADLSPAPSADAVPEAHLWLDSGCARADASLRPPLLAAGR